jgi:hypothetical protein
VIPFFGWYDTIRFFPQNPALHLEIWVWFYDHLSCCDHIPEMGMPISRILIHLVEQIAVVDPSISAR